MRLTRLKKLEFKHRMLNKTEITNTLVGHEQIKKEI